MRAVAGGATFAHRFVREHKRTRLGFVALRATLILRCHREATGRFENVAAVRIVAIHAIHVAFEDGMMLRQIKFGVDIQMTLKTGLGIFAGVDDEFRRAAGPDVFAAGTVAGFATALAGQGGVFKMQPRVRAHRKFTGDVRVAIGAGFVADEMCAGNFQRRDDSGGRGAGNHERHHAGEQAGGDGDDECAF